MKISSMLYFSIIFAACLLSGSNNSCVADVNVVDFSLASETNKAYRCDVDVFPFRSRFDRNSMVEASEVDYSGISKKDELVWQINAPGSGDEIFLWFEMNADGVEFSTKQIDLKFTAPVQNIDRYFSVYVLNAGADPLTTSAWRQVGSQVFVAADEKCEITNSIKSNISDVVDSNGKVVWGVYFASPSNQPIAVDYIRMTFKDRIECDSKVYLPGDVDGNCRVDFDDFLLLTSNWLNTTEKYCKFINLPVGNSCFEIPSFGSEGWVESGSQGDLKFTENAGEWLSYKPDWQVSELACGKVVNFSTFESWNSIYPYTDRSNYGSQVAYLSNAAGWSQTINETLELDTRYLVDFDLGWGEDRPAPEDNNGWFHIQLLAGEEVLFTAGVDMSGQMPLLSGLNNGAELVDMGQVPANAGGWVHQSLVYNADVESPSIGQPLTIRFYGDHGMRIDNLTINSELVKPYINIANGDVNIDDKLDYQDFRLLSDYWLYCTDPDTPFDCEYIQLPKYAEVKSYQGKPMVFVNDSPVYPMFYALTEHGSTTWDETPQKNIKNFANLGFDLFQVDVWFRDIWKADGSLDVESVRQRIRGILTVVPNASVIIRLHVDAPSWWTEANKAECVGYTDGPTADVGGGPDIDRSLRNSIASELWKQQAGEKLIELCNRIAPIPEGKQVIGIHIAGGVYGEWHYWGFPHEPDNGQPMTAYFRQWLSAKYGTVENLRDAWNDQEVDFETASVPGLEDRNYTSGEIFRDVSKEQNVVDFYMCQQKTVADAILYFCELSKENWPRPLITGSFYGYFFNMFAAQTTAGHLQLDRMLESPYLDYLSAPLSYITESRQLGGSGQPRGVLESCRLHGKLWLDEVDQPTYLGDYFKREEPFRQTTPEDSIAVMRRNAMGSFSKGMGMWWYDFGPNGDGGWWDSTELLNEVARVRKLLTPYATHCYTSDADVLLVYDNESFYYLNKSSASVYISEKLVNETSSDLYHAGVVFDTVLLSDLDAVDLSGYKVVIFANTFVINAADRALIKTKVAKDGRNLVWMCASGYIDGSVSDVAYCSDVTGFELNSVEISGSKSINAEFSGNEINFCYTYHNIKPLLCVNDENAQAVGYFAGTSKVALAKKVSEDHTAWYCSLPLEKTEVLREILKDSGAHIYTDTGDVVYSGNGLFTIHSENGGQRQIKLKNGVVIDVALEPRSTYVFDLLTGDELLGW